MSEADVTEPREPEQEPTGELKPEVILEANTLFQGEREIIIQHDGVRYRLRITRRNKLILQK